MHPLFPAFVSTARSPAELARLFDEIGHQLASAPDATEALTTLAQIAADRVAGAERAGITLGRDGKYETVGATINRVRAVDRIQYELGSGPCVDAIIEDTTFNAADLRADPRWQEFGRACVEQTGIISMLPVRFYIEADDALIAALNI